MERMLPKMYKDILGIVSVLCVVSFPHQVVAEESLCHLDFLPQPYSLEEEVGRFVWEFPKVHSQWKVDLNETKEWKKFLHQKPKGTPRIRQPALYLPQVPWNFSQEEKPKHPQVRDIQISSNCPRWTGEPLRLRPYDLEEKAVRQLRERAEPSGSKKRRQLGKKRRLPGKKRKETGERSKLNRLKSKKRSLKEPLRRRQFEGSWMPPWRAQAVLSRYFYSKRSIRHFSETHRTDRTSTSLSIGLSRTSDTSPVQYTAPRQGKKKGLSSWNFGKKKKPRKPKLPRVQQKEWMKVLPQGSVSLKSWKRRNVLWRKRTLESEKNSRKNPEDSKLSRKLNVELESNVQRIPECKYQLPARKRSRRLGSNEKLQNWWRTTSRRMARSRRSRRKLQKLTAQHVRTPSRPMKTSSLHFRKPRRRLRHFRNVWEEPWKLQWLSPRRGTCPAVCSG